MELRGDGGTKKGENLEFLRGFFLIVGIKVGPLVILCVTFEGLLNYT